MPAPNNQSRVTKAVIPAAGKGTRLLPLTKAVPKELIPLGSKPVLEHIVEEVIKAGVTQVLFVISEQKTAIRTHFGDSLNGIRFEYEYQKEQNGLADAISYAQDFADGEPFAVVLGDSIIDTNADVLPFRRVLDTFEQTDAAGVIVVQKTPPLEVSRYGIVKPKDSIAPSFRIDGLVEKPTPEQAPSQYAIAGRYAFDSSIFDYIKRTKPGVNGELQITDSIALMIEDGKDIWCVALGDEEVRRDIGTFESYYEALLIEINRSNRL